MQERENFPRRPRCPRCGESLLEGGHVCRIEKKSTERTLGGELPLEKKISTPEEQEPVEQKSSKDIQEQIKAIKAELKEPKQEKINEILLGDFCDAKIQEGKIVLSPELSVKLNEELTSFFEDIKDSKTAISVGYPVVGVYDVQVKGWTT